LRFHRTGKKKKHDQVAQEHVVRKKKIAALTTNGTPVRVGDGGGHFFAGIKVLSRRGDSAGLTNIMV
jgi:hypothetical protein